MFMLMLKMKVYRVVKATRVVLQAVDSQREVFRKITME